MSRNLWARGMQFIAAPVTMGSAPPQAARRGDRRSTVFIRKE